VSDKKKKKNQFEQAFLEKAFQYSMDDDLASTAKMLRTLKGLLVQTRVKSTLAQKEGSKTAEEYLKELEAMETQPLEGVQADIYTVCSWIGRGVDRAIVWKHGLPFAAVEYPAMLRAMRDIEDRLNIMNGELCNVLDIQLIITGTKKFGWPEKELGEGGMRQRAG